MRCRQLWLAHMPGLVCSSVKSVNGRPMTGQFQHILAGAPCEWENPKEATAAVSQPTDNMATISKELAA